MSDLATKMDIKGQSPRDQKWLYLQSLTSLPLLLIYPNSSRWLCFGMTDWNNGCIVTLLLTYISLESKGNLFMSCCSFSRQFDGTADYMSSPKMDGTMPTCVFWKGWRTHWEFRIHHRFSKCIVYVFIQVFLASHFAFCFNKPTFSP